MAHVYLIKNGDLYKIGRTDNLKRRLKQLQPCTVIQTLETNRSRDLEYELHQKYKSKRLPQTEYFRLTPSEADEVCVALGGGVPEKQRTPPPVSKKYRNEFSRQWEDPEFRKEMTKKYWTQQIDVTVE